MKKIIRLLIPLSQRKKIHTILQYLVFRYSIRKFKSLIARDKIDQKILERLIYGWGNQAFSADATYLTEIINSGLENRSTVLECGSGLSTIIMGIIADMKGFTLYALEHDEDWAARVQTFLKEDQIRNVEVLRTPLKQFSEFDWYDVDPDEIPDDISLVICDGPPGITRGGRYGLLPVMAGNLTAGCNILVDDYHREAEKKMIVDWKEVWPIDVIKSTNVFTVLELHS